jgi:hypothetical protein
VAIAQEPDKHAMDQPLLTDDRVAHFGNQLTERLALDIYLLRKLLELSVGYGGR